MSSSEIYTLLNKVSLSFTYVTTTEEKVDIWFESEEVVLELNATVRLEGD